MEDDIIRSNPSTELAGAEHASEKRLFHEAGTLSTLDRKVDIFDAIPDIVFILNHNRQIVFANLAFLEVSGINDREKIYGLRPGEALNCVNAFKKESSCGKEHSCRNCGTVKATRFGLVGEKIISECRISQKTSGRTFDFRITASPLRANGDPYVIIVATDISNEKRKDVLERTFFHDISNTLTNIICFAELLSLSPVSECDGLIEKLIKNINSLEDEIVSQRKLMSTENRNLTVQHAPINSLALLDDIASRYKIKYPTHIEIDSASTEIMFFSDRTLLSRVIGNMLKNALEASESDEVVLVGCRLEDDAHVSFWVQNCQLISFDTQHQIFNRSFSTKGKERGFGTYSMKLLTEKYLKGNVSFMTSLEKGTVFSVTIPVKLINGNSDFKQDYNSDTSQPPAI